MDRRGFVRLSAGVVIMIAAGCRSTQAPPPSRLVIAPAAARAASGPASLEPPIPPLEARGLPPLSDAGILALGILQRTERFTNDAVGEGGETPLQVDAMRALFREPSADAAFKALLDRGTREGRMFALCGLWYTDPATFKAAVDRILESEGDEPVHTFFGCTVDEMKIADLLRHPGEDPVVRLKDRSQTIRQWCEETRAMDAYYDIEGGAYPSLFRYGGGGDRE